VHHRRVEAAAHCGRTGDRVCPGRLGHVDLDVDHRLGAVAGGRDAGVLELGGGRFFGGLGSSGNVTDGGNAHQSPSLFVEVPETNRTVMMSTRTTVVYSTKGDDDAHRKVCQGDFKSFWHSVC